MFPYRAGPLKGGQSNYGVGQTWLISHARRQPCSLLRGPCGSAGQAVRPGTAHTGLSHRDKALKHKLGFTPRPAPPFPRPCPGRLRREAKPSPAISCQPCLLTAPGAERTRALVWMRPGYTEPGICHLPFGGSSGRTEEWLSAGQAGLRARTQAVKPAELRTEKRAFGFLKTIYYFNFI